MYPAPPVTKTLITLTRLRGKNAVLEFFRRQDARDAFSRQARKGDMTSLRRLQSVVPPLGQCQTPSLEGPQDRGALVVLPKGARHDQNASLLNHCRLACVGNTSGRLVCHACWLVQLPEFVSPSHIFTEYAYFVCNMEKKASLREHSIYDVFPQSRLSPLHHLDDFC